MEVERGHVEQRRGQGPLPTRMRHAGLPVGYEELAHRVIGLAIEVHRTLGAGLLESLYEEALDYELTAAGIPHSRQLGVEVPYKTTVLRGQRLDLLVADKLVVELKSASEITDLFVAQTIGYLRAIDQPLGLILNFNSVLMTNGIKRVINARWTGFASIQVLGHGVHSPL